jgi:F-type H+-transporting ATPase subunit b
MPRLTPLALGLLILALAAGPPARSARAAQEGHAPAAGAAHEKEAAQAAEPNILEFRPPLAVATLIVFVALLLVLWRFAWGPLSKALTERERHNEETLRASEHARAESERLLAEHRAQMERARDEINGMFEKARREAQSTADDIVRKAQADAESARGQARRDIESARDQALMEIWSKGADLAVSVAGKVLERDLGPDDHRRLVAAAQEALPSAPPTTNGHGGHA